ncbi:glycosyltransferase family 2 protein [Haladaptatus sp. W1]|uniref:glycosyltransferase family 2 protein n=1 Tax=Haladaptatus sp. W1 TaxID=1897478 RepID=UPI0009F5A5FB|nr:glycosyltransferase family A protein [Haladaptatus sp. W1]
MPEISLGVVVFNRTEKLKNLLQSVVETDINKVYVADNGKGSEEKKKLYNSNFSFELKVLDLPYDSGLGYGRHEIVKELKEEYLIIVDSDNTVPPNVTELVQLLESKPTLGGACGMLIESNRIYSACRDLYEYDGLISYDIRGDKKVNFEPIPHIKFDFLPNVCAFKKECLDDYSWDPNYTIGREHIDFFTGHLNTNWEFALCPAVQFGHFPDGPQSYMSKRTDPKRILADKEYYLTKWGYDQIVHLQPDWFHSKRSSSRLLSLIMRTTLSKSPSFIQKMSSDLQDLILLYSGYMR